MKKYLALISLLFSTHFIASFALAGRDITVQATGDYLNFDLSGRDGQGGDEGDDGIDGNCTYDDDGNRISDSGGDGEDGESGDHGEAGGDITIIYNDLRDLKKMSVFAEGGRGGSGGRGGRGGRACGNASDGDDGDDGWSGSSGSDGKVYLVHKKYTPYKEENIKTYISLQDLVGGKEVVSQLWSEKTGADSLLASGSIVQNQYAELEGYQLGFAKVNLAEPLMIKKELMNEGQFFIDLNHGTTQIDWGSFVGLGHLKTKGSTTELDISRLYLKSNLNSLKYKKVIGEKPYRKILLKTQSELIPMPQLNIHLKVEVKGRWFKYFSLFKGRVEQRYIEKTPKGYLLDLDRMPLSQKIVRGAKIRLTMTHELQEQNLRSISKSETWVTRIR